MIAQVNGAYFKTRPSRTWSRVLAYAFFEGRPLTTRGQWINPLLFRFFELQKRLPVLREPIAPVFIVGTGRSGTTILGLVLSMHRDVGFLNEPKAIWASLRDDEDIIGSYHRGLVRYRLAPQDATAVLCNGLRRIYGTYLRLSMTTRIVDKYPELIFRVPFIKQIFPDAKFLFLSRNGWDTCGSIDSWSERQRTDEESETHDWWGVNRRKWTHLVEQIVPEHADLSPYTGDLLQLQDQRAMAATEWIVTMREGLRLLREYPEDVFHVRYESLCSDPSRMCRRIAQFVGLSPDEVFLEYAETVLSPATVKNEFFLPSILDSAFRETAKALNAHKAQ